MLTRGERQSQRLNDAVDKLVLKPEYVSRRRLRRVGPDHRAGGRLNKLRGHANVFAIRQDGAGKDRAWHSG